MVLSDISIKRPVFASMVTLAIVVFGMVLYTRLNVDLYPKINFPIVTVTVIYPGAGSSTMESQVAEPIEDAVSALGGVRTVRSTSLEGVSQIVVEFELDIPVGVATQDVRDKLAAIQQTLPAGAEAPIVQKIDLGAAPILQLSVSGDVDPTLLFDYAENTLRPALEKINGVGEIGIVGGRKREMHVWIKPYALLAFELTVDDVVRTLGSQNIELPGGRMIRSGNELAVRTRVVANTEKELGQLVVATKDGAVIHLSDLATIEDGYEEQRSIAYVGGKSALIIVVQKRSDANTVVVAEALQRELPGLQKAIAGGMKLEVLTDNSKSIKSSIDTVKFDLLLGGLLAVFIIFIFLRDWRATLISALALPTSVIGTFGFVAVMGFTLNMMTTLALSLSIGILIDDAIVVIENIVRRMTSYGENAEEASIRGTSEIGLAVFATTLSIVAVFVPVAFMEGVIGQFFFEFGLTVAFAVLLSLFVSFTLTPMLSSKFLQVHHQPKGLSLMIENVLLGMENFYRKMVSWALTHRLITSVVAIGFLGATIAITPLLGFEFVPAADTSQFKLTFELSPGTTLNETAERSQLLAERIRKIPGVESTFTTIGGGGLGSVEKGTVSIKLVPKDARNFKQSEVMSLVRTLFKNEPNMKISVAVDDGGGQNTAVLQINFLGDDLDAIAKAATQTAAKLEKLGGYVDLGTTFKQGKPELLIEVNRDRAADLGVNGVQIATTVRTLVAGNIATRVENHGERYDVRVQLPVGSRALGGPNNIEPKIRTAQGHLVDFTSIATFKTRSSSTQVDHLSRQIVITLNSNLEGKVLGDASKEAMAIALKEAGPGISVEIGGDAKMLEETTASMLLALFLAMIFVYMILASQFESFVHPFTIMSSMPFSLIGAFGGLLLVGMPMSIFGMIGLIMLMGLVTKNGILLVDFAMQKLASGETLNKALEEAGAVRLRPILMTTTAMVFGMLPVAIGHGDGGEVRAPMGVIVIGGLISSTLLTLIVLPVIFNLIENLLRKVKKLAKKDSPVL